MPVGKALEQITDAGVFEQLATAVLRRAVPEARGLIHVGLNAAGRTVKSPVDGIAPGDEQAGYLLVSHTSTAVRELRTKWLDDDEGDLAKALAIVRAERARGHSAPFKLALCTNRVPDETLVRDVQAAAYKEGVHVVFLERSRLADYLEHEPDGQWLAAQYLGITQRRLSADLLRKISAESAAEFADSVLDNPDYWVGRQLDETLASSTAARIATFVIMPPGSGKTVAAVRLLNDWVKNGGAGVWVPDAVLDSATTFEQALDSAMRRYAPALEPFSGSVALSLCREQAPLLVVIDDIARAANPVAALERLAGWIANSTLASPFRIVCPVWPQVVEATRDASRLWIQQRSITAVTSAAAECAAAVQRRATQAGSPITQLEAENIASRLGNDLLLVALRAVAGPATPTSLIVSEFIENSLRACASSGSRFVPADFQAALDTLAIEMLTRRVMEPTWAQISDWLAGSPDHLACIREIANGRKLCHLQGPIDEQHLAFRHNRVRASVFAGSLRRRIHAKVLSDDIMSEPYYAEFLGLALATARESDKGINRLKERNPLALVYALVAAEASETALIDALVSAIGDWLGQPGSQSRGNESVCFQMHLALASVDSPAVMRVAEHFAVRTWALDIAKLRNGDAIGGASFCLSSGPSVNDPQRDQLIDHVLAHHRTGILAAVAALLWSDATSTTLLSGALYLAGFLGQTELTDPILSAWKRRGKADLIPEFLWAASLCCGSRPEETIEPIVDALRQVPDTKDSLGQNRRSALLHNEGLQFGFARRLQGAAVRYLVERAQDSELTGPLVGVLEKVDDEHAAAFIAEQMGAVSRRLEGTGSWSPWLSDDWYDPSGHRRYGLRSRDNLRTLWADSSQDKHVRRYAFQLWCTDVSEGELDILRGIARDDVLDDRAVRARLELGDLTAAPRFREKVGAAKHPSFWWQFVQRSWRDVYLSDLRAELDRRRENYAPSWTKGFDTDHNIAGLIATLSPDLATELLALHWDHLRYSSDFVQTALYVATETCASLVSDTVSETPNPKEMFRFLGMHWQIGGRAQANRLTLRRLAGLEPYLDLLDDSTVHSLWEGCNTDGFIDWRRRFLDSRLSELWRTRAGLFESDLREDLDRIASGPGRPWPYHWLEEFERRGETAARAVTVASGWFAGIKSLRAFELLAECVAQAGRRQDLSLLDVRLVPETDAEAAHLIYQNAQFTLFKRTLV